jgi:hypothetical protein
MRFSDARMEKATKLRAQATELASQVEVLRVLEKLGKHSEFDAYYGNMEKLARSKISLLLAMKPNTEVGLEHFHFERDRILAEINMITLVAEAPKRASVEIPQIEAKIDELEAEAASIEQKYGAVSMKGMPNGGQKG